MQVQKRGIRFWLFRGLLAATVLFFAATLFGLGYQWSSTRADAARYPPPGRMVDVGGFELHVYCTGQGSPTVILDALFPGTVSNWAWVQPELAKSTRVCAYDRAGLGWSDSGPEPRDALRHAQELHALLQNADIDGPYVLVGHSLGGLFSRMFADQYPNEVAGMALVEATNPDTWVRRGLPEGVGVDSSQLAIGSFLSRFGLFRAGIIPAYGSDPDLPPQQRQELQAFFDSTKSMETIRSMDASFAVALDQVRKARDLDDRPLATILGAQGDGGADELKPLFEEQAALSSNSISVMVEGATHAGLVDNQTAAAETTRVILRVVEAVRSGRPLNSPQALP